MAADSLKGEKREGETLKKDTELQKYRSLLIILEVIPNSSVSFIRCLRGVRLLQHYTKTDNSK